MNMLTKKTIYKEGAFDTQEFTDYLTGIIHEWSLTLTALVFMLVPSFYILDYFTMPERLLAKFALYRIMASGIAVIQYFIIRNTKPRKLSYVHGYIVSFVVGGTITLMTVDLGGFDSSYYAGLNLVIIGVNLLLPWNPVHSIINGIIILASYTALNLFFGDAFDSKNLINNLFFMNATIIIAVSINRVRYELIKQEFVLRSELKETRDALWGEMEIAKKIQTSLLPDQKLIGNYSIASTMVPASEVGGDYYDIIETDVGEQWVAIGDVSGHGVESGLIMMMTQTSILTMINRTEQCSPSKVIEYINRIIRKNLERLKLSRYMTILVVRLEQSKIIAAGKHQDIIIYRAQTRKIQIQPTEGTWIGLTDDISDYVKDMHIDIEVGDMVLFFTDGATEATNKDGDMYGYDRLISALDRYADMPVQDIINYILFDIVNFQQEQDDDITLMIIKRES